MKFKIKYAVIIGVISLFILILSACSSNSITGKYNSVAGRYEDYVFTGEEIKGSSLELKDDSSMELVLLEQTYSGVWSCTDTEVIMQIGDEQITASRGDNFLTIENLTDMGITMIFAKEGTKAENLENYLTEKEKASLGTWKSTTIKNSSGKDITSEFPQNGFIVTICSDHKLSVKFNSQDVLNDDWYMVGSDGFNKNMGANTLSWTISDDNKSIEFSYTDQNNTYKISCVK